MTLYQELPKLTIMSELKHHFTDPELDAVRLDLFDLLNSCRTLDELRVKIAAILKDRSSSAGYFRLHHENLTAI